MARHGVAQFAPELEGVLAAARGHQLVVQDALAGQFGRVAAVAFLRREPFGIGKGVWPRDKAAVDAGQQGVRAQAVGPVDGVVGLPGGKDAR